MTDRKPRCVVIGLDGIPFDWVQRLAESDRAPTLKAMLRRGFLARTVPHVLPHTAEVAGCFLTGRNPGRTGAYGWEHLLPSGEPALTRFDDLGPVFWEHLAGEALAIGLPLTSPVRAIRGAVIANPNPYIFVGRPEASCYPRSLLATARSCGLLEAIEGAASIGSMLRFPNVRELMIAQMSLADQLWDENSWSLIMNYFSQTDWVLHRYELISPFLDDLWEAAVVRELVADIDAWIGHVLGRLTPKDHVVLWSDHGWGRFDWEANPLRLLATSGEAGDDIPIAVAPYPAYHAANVVGLRVASPQAPRSPEVLDTLRASVERTFNRRLSPFGHDVSISLGSVRFHGEQTVCGPDLICEFPRDVLVDPDFPEPLLRRRHFSHTHDGFLLLYGPAIQPGTGSVGYRGYDLAATVSFLAEGTIIDGLDGRVIEEALRAPAIDGARHMEALPDGAWSRPAPFTPDEEARLRKSLSDLGYL